jgi:SAM-dependent methyltransferase
VSAVTTRQLYDAHARGWARAERSLLSDFTARPHVLAALQPLTGMCVLDLGCGEGYVARLVAAAGAAAVEGIDISPAMVDIARASIPPSTTCSFRFAAADAAALPSFAGEQFDRIIAVFLFNYLTRAQTLEVLKSARAGLAPGGVFVFTVPHPCFPYMRAPAAPFFFETQGHSYFAGADVTFEGRIWRRDGTHVPVRCVHKTIGDYFDLLAEAGWRSLPKVIELGVEPEHVAIDPEFFGPLLGQPLHVLFRLEAS